MNTKMEEHFSGDFCRKTTLQGNGETGTFHKKNDQLTCHRVEDFEHLQNSNKFIDITFDLRISKSLKPPHRILTQRPSRNPQQIAEDLERKLQESSIRRHNHINNIIQRSRQQNEKVMKARERIASRKTEEAAAKEKEQNDKKQSAEQIREKFISERVEKFRKQIQHGEAVKSKKLINILP